MKSAAERSCVIYHRTVAVPGDKWTERYDEVGPRLIWRDMVGFQTAHNLMLVQEAQQQCAVFGVREARHFASDVDLRGLDLVLTWCRDYL
jgi:hypothetical protein